MGGIIDTILHNMNGGDSYDKAAKNLNDRFISELNYMAGSEKYLPRLASADMKYNFLLQKNRFKEHRLTMKRRYTANEKSVTGVSMLMGSDKRYITRIPLKTCDCETTYIQDNGKQRRYKTKETILSYTVFVNGQTPDASYCCPNCGDINKVRQLVETGCRSCKTRFILSDLYPRITNYYTMREKAYVSFRPQPGIIAGILGGLIYGAVSSAYLYSDNIIMAVLTTLISGSVGGILGFFLYAVLALLMLAADSIVGAIRYSAYNKTRKKLPAFMKNYDPFFSIDFFVGRANNLLKTIVFTNDLSNCAVYNGNIEANELFPDIIDVEYQGIMGLNSVTCDGSFVYADVNIYTKTTLCKNKKIKQKDEIFRMKLCRSVNVHDDCNTSIHNIECKSCGASFNAVREKNCPYCKSPYDLKNYDWIATGISRQ